MTMTTKEKILKLRQRNPDASRDAIAKAAGCSPATVTYHLKNAGENKAYSTYKDIKFMDKFITQPHGKRGAFLEAHGLAATQLYQFNKFAARVARTRDQVEQRGFINPENDLELFCYGIAPKQAAEARKLMRERHIVLSGYKLMFEKRRVVALTPESQAALLKNPLGWLAKNDNWIQTNWVIMR